MNAGDDSKRKTFQGLFRDDDQLGYRAVNTGPGVTPETARIEPVNAKLQAEAERILWDLRQK